TAPRGRDPFARAPSPLRGTPPFRYRSTGERSVRSAPPPPFGVLPVSLPLHGGEIRSLRAPSPLRGTPPFRYRSTGERSVRSRLFGVVPPFRYRSTGERSVRAPLFRGPPSAA